MTGIRSAPQHRIHGLCHLPLSLLEHVPVGIRRQRDRAVAQEILDVLEGHALRQQVRRGGVAEVMEAAVGEGSAPEGPLERSGDPAASMGVPMVVAKT